MRHARPNNLPVTSGEHAPENGRAASVVLWRFVRQVWWFRPWNRVRVLWIEEHVVVAESIYWLWWAVPACYLIHWLDVLDRLDTKKPKADFMICDLSNDRDEPTLGGAEANKPKRKTYERRTD